jgi:hypothetical protein
MGIFTDLFSSAPADAAAKAKIAGLQSGNTQAGTDLTAGQTGADTLYGRAQGAYAPLVSSTGAGSAAYGDATGANGSAGLARAKALYQADPGYSGGLTTGIDQVMRTSARAGNLGGGQNSADEIKFASDYDANKYGSYVNSLAPYLGANQNAVSGQAGTYGAQAGADLGVAGQRAGYAYNTASGVGNANADAAMAPYSASQNFWGSLLGAGNLALKASGVGGYAPSTGIVLGGPGGPGVRS